jgi:hypothetical protein
LLSIQSQRVSLRFFGGSLADDWNMRLLNNVGSSVPVTQSNTKSSNEAITAVCNAMVDMAPADPIEGILIGQIVAANKASLAMYRKGWAQPPEYFAARTKYLQLADKAARTVMMLTERLDHHRGRGQQQITVKHVTTNNVTADQAIIADSVTNRPCPPTMAHLLLFWPLVRRRPCRYSTGPACLSW